MFQKLFTAKQIKEIDNQSIIRQNITSEKLMERAVNNLRPHITKELSNDKHIYIFCGKGNNGGDGLVLARLLQPDYHVSCVIVPFSKKSSADFESNFSKLQNTPVEILDFSDNNKPDINENDIIIDAIFGTGLSRPADGIARQSIEFINESGAKILSIDIPSGLYADRSNQTVDTIIKADKVYSFQFPKISFFFPENAGFVKDFEVVDIGLDSGVINEMPSKYFMLTSAVEKMLKKRPKTGYKNSFGHALIVGGSYGMIGAPVLASKAALRIGTGLVNNFLPRCGYPISQTYVPEVMCLTDTSKKHISKIEVPGKITAIGIGMGMGTKPKTQKALKQFLKNNTKPLLLDADALNILALNPKWLKHIPKKSILTPHEGEFKRLVGDWQNDSEKWQKLKDFSAQYQVITVLKGAYTTISDGEFFYINPVANPALATAGSGDVLSGMITGLLAQAYQAMEAALLGVYLHAQTAEKYVEKYRDYSMIASDIIKEIKSD